MHAARSGIRSQEDLESGLDKLQAEEAAAEKAEPAESQAELQAAAALPGPAGAQVQLALARHYESTGAVDGAIAAYTRYLEEEPRGAATQLARARIVALGGEPPAAASNSSGIQVTTN